MLTCAASSKSRRNSQKRARAGSRRRARCADARGAFRARRRTSTETFLTSRTTARRRARRGTGGGTATCAPRGSREGPGGGRPAYAARPLASPGSPGPGTERTDRSRRRDEGIEVVPKIKTENTIAGTP